jgi:hypothetical protein
MMPYITCKGNFNDKKQNMKKQLLSILGAFATSFAMAQSIPNGGFEHWTTTSCQNPQYFNSSNLQNHGGGGGLGPVNVKQTTDAFHGNFAVKMTTTAIGPVHFLLMQLILILKETLLREVFLIASNLPAYVLDINAM